MKKILVSAALCSFSAASFPQTTITVNPAVTYQTLFGMGGAGTGNAAYTACLVDNMGLSAFRYYMDGSWSGKDGAASGDITEANINAGVYNFYKTTADTAFFRRLKSKGVTNIVSTSWSSPVCVGGAGGATGGTSCASVTPGKETAFGKFMAAFVKDFNTRTGQTLYALNIQNEPLFCEPYPSGILNANDFGPQLQKVRAEFTNDTVKNTKFFGPEHMGSMFMNKDYFAQLLNSPTYGPLLDIYAVHSYLDGITADLGSAAGWNGFYQEVCVKNNKPLWMSETDWNGVSGEWGYLLDHHRQIFSALKYGKVSAWIYWGMGTFYNGATPSPQMYVCKHYMRFIRPGYKQIEVTENDADIGALGFINPATNDVTIVAVNTSITKSKTFSFNDFANKPAAFDMYRSTAKENCCYMGKLTGNSFYMPAYSVVTLYFNASEAGWQWGPSMPADLIVTDTTDNSISISWSSPGSWVLHSPSGNTTVNITGYSIYQDGTKKNGTSPTNKTTWTFSGLKPGTTYVLDVVCRDALYNESTMGRLIVKTTCSEGGCIDTNPIVELEDIKQTISVSPNPASENIKINLPEGEKYNITIISIAGKIVLEKPNVSGLDEIAVSAFSKGIYVLIAKNGDKVYQTKFVVE